jgi:hypothetical protein
LLTRCHALHQAAARRSSSPWPSLSPAQTLASPRPSQAPVHPRRPSTHCEQWRVKLGEPSPYACTSGRLKRSVGAHRPERPTAAAAPHGHRATHRRARLASGGRRHGRPGWRPQHIRKTSRGGFSYDTDIRRCFSNRKRRRCAGASRQRGHMSETTCFQDRQPCPPMPLWGWRQLPRWLQQHGGSSPRQHW